ncbi:MULTISPECIES: aminotransferase class I/II-fold pyridoxal phosphate-dependent enzyme [unclassified Dehalobacter]|uniref:aminotransferase class I/II-fold pyridoxal phosphate-dependent enzyme n=1 Tax=unclassified Dehalobacter TaxID=2635733 RepID=UPI000E6D22D8|nr:MULTISPECIES: aminotransferase class I/II-fold pyridoxal phosphate-dependent enzyme [unclassified Dehalobacter]RJE46894.1 aromatic amino acid aminotransferase [Dehalobacter sp. MCB1]TCX50817.1 aromatic amino acid aminotransferase [Dehalobacter sp. 12DCB1]TCX51528.1 aromatic amino acid aminotransferase [Dehalobacter sp. 14DCB1]
MKQYLSPLAFNLKPSGIRKFFDLAATVEGVISLGVGEPDFATPWVMTEAAIFSLEQGQTMYTSNAGLIELRRELSKYMAKHQGLSYNADQEIFITVGASEAIDLAMRALIVPGDGVLIPDPSFVAYAACAEISGAEVHYVKTSAEHDFRLQVEDLQMAYTPNCKILVLSYPNNPTGAVMTREELLPIARFASENDLIVISDEIYSDLNYGGEHTPFATLPYMRNRTLHVSGFSKAYAMTGWRIGYVAGHPDLIQAMLKIHQYTIMCAPIMAQVAALEGLKSGETAKQEMVMEYDRRRRIMVHGLREMGLTCFEPLGAFYVFPDITATGLNSEAFAEQLLKEEKVAVVPGTAFGPAGEGHVRCSYAYSTQQLQEALTRMSRFVKKRINCK